MINLDEQVTSTVIEMLKQMQNNMNSRFDRMEERHENVKKQVSDLDRDAVRRQEFQETFKSMLEEFSKMTMRLESEVRALAGMKPIVDSIVPRIEQEAQWRLQEQTIEDLRVELENLKLLVHDNSQTEEQIKREKRQFYYSIIAGVSSSGIFAILAYTITHVKW